MLGSSKGKENAMYHEACVWEYGWSFDTRDSSGSNLLPSAHSQILIRAFHETMSSGFCFFYIYISLPLISIIWFSMFATVCKGQEQTSLRRLMVRSRSWFSAISFSFSLRSVIVWWVWNCTSLRSCSFSIMVLFVFCDIIVTTSDKTFISCAS